MANQPHRPPPPDPNAFETNLLKGLAIDIANLKAQGKVVPQNIIDLFTAAAEKLVAHQTSP
jgi:hypothetical protein